VRDGTLPQQIRLYVGDAAEVEPARRAADGCVAIVGVKLLARAVDEVHAAEFRTRLDAARRCGLPVAVHAVEADVVAAVLDALRDAPPRRSGEHDGLPDRLEHCSLCPPELVRRVAAQGVAVVTQPAFLAARGVKYVREVEPPLWPWLYPLRALRVAGVLVAGSSDAPIVPLDPRLGLDGATRRRAGDGTVLAPGETLDDGAALDLFTSSVARLRGAVGPLGVVAGAPADLLVAESGLLGAAAAWRALRVRHTLAAGRIIA
jgi:predicted amidohydrolase YtcJ